tara:strand:- start:1979 stop:2293 length:315 start_codon:yes stop_codon:yes gene_type:complete
MLITLKNKIEDMTKLQQIDILRLLSSYDNVKLNENNNGTFVNLTELDKEIIDKLEEYVNYVDAQTIILEKTELEKSRLENIYFKDNNKEKDNKDISTENIKLVS